MASIALVGCSTGNDKAAAASSTKAAPATAVAFPEPPPYTYEIHGKEIRVSTGSADPHDLLNTYNKVARTLRPTLPEGGYWIGINCTTGGTEKADRRLANGTIAVGQLGKAQIGGLGKFEGVVSGAQCP
ncbi:hypothetical protein [Nocardia sp. NPDC051570]|uniref:hypothetical protein n=1 Tax=Nocardia sp. NPDC051570 TaxID=3364324 RepID=UPI0037976EDF